MTALAAVLGIVLVAAALGLVAFMLVALAAGVLRAVVQYWRGDL